MTIASSVLPEWFREDRWVPPPGSVDGRQVMRLVRAQNLSSYHDLLSASADPDWFYPRAFDDLELSWMMPFSRVTAPASPQPWRTWFPGGRTNAAWLACTRWAGKTPAQLAVVGETEDGTTTRWTFADLDQQVAACAEQLSDAGIGMGDTVALLLPMCPEATAAVLAAASIGAIAVPLFSGYGPGAIRERLRIAGCRVLITADGFVRAGRVVPTLETAREATAETETTIVVVNRLETPLRPGELRWREHPTGPAPQPVALPAGAPFLLGFTSGSTGQPKAVVHTHGGFPYRVAIDLAYGFDLRQGDRMTWVTDMGWIMGPLSALGPLALGATAFVFEGLITYPRPGRLWDVARDQRITVVGVTPTLVRSLISADVPPGSRLPDLKAIGITGEPCPRQVWRWLHREVGRGHVPVINWTGGAEIGAGILISSPAVETPECRFSGPCLGIPADVYGPAGTPVTNSPGELVLTQSVPSMTRGLWGQPDRYLATYWSRWPGVWLHGDQAVRYADGSWELTGRSDEVMKVGGKRIDPAEFEEITAAVDGVLECAAVAVPDERLGEAPVIAVRARPETTAAEVRDAVIQRIIATLGPAFRPREVIVADALPLNRAGKVQRRVLRAWLLGQDPGDLINLANPEARQGLAGRLGTPVTRAEEIG